MKAFNQRPVSENLALAIATCKMLSLEELHDLSKSMRQVDTEGAKTWAGAITIVLDRKFDRYNEMLRQN